VATLVSFDAQDEELKETDVDLVFSESKIAGTSFTARVYDHMSQLQSIAILNEKNNNSLPP